MLFSVFAGIDAGVFAKDAAEMALRGKAEIDGDGRQRLVGIAEKALCLLRFFFEDEIGEGLPGLLPELFGKIRAAHKEFLRHPLRRDRLGDMPLNVIRDVGGQLCRP